MLSIVSIRSLIRAANAARISNARSLSSLSPVIYTATSTSTGSRASGHSVTKEKNISVLTGYPIEMGGAKGPEGGDANPEQLFGMAYSTCFLSALSAAHAQLNPGMGSLPRSTRVRASVSIGKSVDTKIGGFTLAVLLEIPSAPLTEANVPSIEKLIDAAHAMCPYSRATRGNIEVEIKVAEE